MNDQRPPLLPDWRPVRILLIKCMNVTLMLSNELIYLGVDEKTAVEDACKIEQYSVPKASRDQKAYHTGKWRLPADMKEDE